MRNSPPYLYRLNCTFFSVPYTLLMDDTTQKEITALVLATQLKNSMVPDTPLVRMSARSLLSLENS